LVKTIKNIRLRDYDYRNNGFYFITICSNYKAEFTDNERSIINEHIDKIESIAKGINRDYFELVSNHLHLILILDNCSLNIGEIVRRFKAITSKEANRKLWQPNYYEHVIRTERALGKIREYIRNNPLKEMLDMEEIYGKGADKSATTEHSAKSKLSTGLDKTTTQPMNRQLQ